MKTHVNLQLIRFNERATIHLESLKQRRKQQSVSPEEIDLMQDLVLTGENIKQSHIKIYLCIVFIIDHFS
jgi:hypothetical protein